MNRPDLEAVQTLVIQAARDELLPRFNSVSHHYKDDGSLITEADLAMNARLQKDLADAWPDVAFLSEEMDAERQTALLSGPDTPLWCLDPLDGTSNFAAGLPAFAVSLALIQDGEPMLGIIYDPLRDECYAARHGGGTWLNGAPLKPMRPNRPLKRAMALVDFKRLPATLAQRLAAEAPYGSQRNFGSCALEWAWMAAGRGHVYLHGGQKLWDYAAGALILEESRGHCCTLDGQSVFRASLGARSVISSPDESLFADWCRWLGVEPANP